MIRLSAALALLFLALAAGSARAAEFGANDDTGKFLGDSGRDYFTAMAAVGLRTNVITLPFIAVRPLHELNPAQRACAI